MYLRTIQRKNRDGSVVRYVQLAHNVWNPDKGYATAQVIHSFGREDQLDRAALERLVASIARYLGPETELEVAGRLDPADTTRGELGFCWSKPAGGALAADGLWRRFGIDRALKALLADRRVDERAERVIFAMVANRLLASDDHKSKLACLEWAQGDVFLPGVGDLGDDPNVCYRAMDLLLEVEEELAGLVFDNVANLLDLECDLLLFDTTSTFFEIDEADGPEDDPGFRSRGHSKDHRPDLPQVVVGMAVTRTGIPIRVWCWPGHTGDSPLIRQVKDDLTGWRLHRVVWVADRGFTSEANRRYLQRGGGHYILGEKLRGGSKEAQAALKRQGRYRTVRDNLRVKEVTYPLDDGVGRDRFVVCHNPDEAERDKTIRGQIVAQLEQAIAGSDDLSEAKRSELYGQLSTRPTYKRFLRRTKGGKLRIDRAAITADTKLDGKFLLRTSDPSLTAEDVALGYKQLPLIERGWRSMKQLELRPIFHRLEDRIRAHIILCWLALLLLRIAENATGETWRTLRRELQRLHVGGFTGSAGTVIRRTDLTARQAAIFSALDLKPPPEFLAIATPDEQAIA